MNRRRYLLASILCVLGVAGWMFVAARAQKEPLKYPEARKGDVIDDYHGTKVADPYRWLEDGPEKSPDVAQWIAAENSVTGNYLKALPVRDELKKRITELWNYPKVSTPGYEGGRWFYTRNSGVQKQNVVYMRTSLTGSETLVLDPKGDMTNLALVFPDLQPASFRPWVSEAEAQAAGVSVDEYAEKQATVWREGLASNGIGPERLQALKDAADVTVYTPGSTAGVPLNIIGSLKAPALSY
jgi:protease II